MLWFWASGLAVLCVWVLGVWAGPVFMDDSWDESKTRVTSLLLYAVESDLMYTECPGCLGVLQHIFAASSAWL